ncbi:Gfo/Idh/MocA family protein [Sphingobacterium luzhongxinii]|uniref:Gfo/Idh/MocA family protein n=1 Tax=Sphingobacterium luzhongxinii TaxID=2654181 RepID=UPI0013D99CF6|nr:Gfo/Idh/MocA family oxidoreductase [Sphingobacterium sp. xlx-73]
MKVLIVGLGSIATKHITALREIDRATEIYALRSGNSSVSDIKEGVINVFELSDFDMNQIDFVIVANPTAYHFATITQFIEFGKPLFIEKPIFSEITEETNALVSLVVERNILTYVACNLRFLESIIKIKKLINDERINEVNVYGGSFLPDWRPTMDYRTVYSANKDMGGGVHIDLIHELDYIYWLLGEPLDRRAFFSNRSTLDISAFDYANYLWIYKEFSVSIILNYYRRDSKRTLEIVTERATYLVDLLNNAIYMDGNLIFSSNQRIKDTYTPQMNYFLTEVLKGSNSFNTIEEANRILELCIQD